MLLVMFISALVWFMLLSFLLLPVSVAVLVGGGDGGVCMRLISCRMFLHIVVQGLWINWHFAVLYMCCLLRTTSAIACSLLYFVSPCNLLKILSNISKWGWAIFHLFTCSLPLLWLFVGGSFLYWIHLFNCHHIN